MKVLFCIILTLIFEVNSDNDSGWALVGNPLSFAYPCNGSTDITTIFESGLPPEQENSYTLNIHKKFIKSTIIILKFDADASVELTNKTFARLRYEELDNSFVVRFYKAHENIVLKVQGLLPGVVPYFKSIEINSVEYCKNPNVGYLDRFIHGYEDHAESSRKKPSSNCGRRKITHTELIVNGAPTKAGDWPWHAALYRLDRSQINYICGGTLISKYFVLTAAHCTSIRGQALLPETLSVVLGKYNLVGGDDGTQEKEVHQIIIHNEFGYRNLNNDIALLKLRTEAMYTDYVQPACLWYPKVYEKLPTNEILGAVVGWGFDITDNLSHQLRQAKMPVVSESTCLKSNPSFYPHILNDNKFCAGYKNGTSACNGDSGGSFQVFVPDETKDNSPKAAGAWYIKGIVSVTVARTDAPICDPEQYVVFTDVAKYLHWIENNTKT